MCLKPESTVLHVILLNYNLLSLSRIVTEAMPRDTRVVGCSVMSNTLNFFIGSGRWSSSRGMEIHRLEGELLLNANTDTTLT